jgi:hypothetical protein
MNTSVNLLPGKGMDDLFFGMDETHIEKKLGSPDFKEVFEDKEFGKTRVLYYFDQGLTFYFDEEDDFRLGCLEVDAMAFSLWGENIARISKKKLKKFLSEKGITEIEEEKDEHQDALVAEVLSATFYFEFDTLISVQLGVNTDEEENPLWPVKDI